MKICPFISHMLGDDNSVTWTLEGESSDKSSSTSKKQSGSVVILGYEDGDSNTQTDTMTQVATKSQKGSTVPSHLYCLEKSCRFYKEKTGDCQFDLTLSLLEEQNKKSAKPSGPNTQQLAKDVSKDIAKDIDKIWKFQTKSVTEMVKSIGDIEKGQTKTVTTLKKDFEKSLDILASKIEKTPTADIKKALTDLQKRIDDREQGMEDLSGTMSELVLNLHESITKLEERSAKTHKTVDSLSGTMVTADTIKELVEETVAKSLKDLKPQDLTKPLNELGRQLDSLTQSRGTDPKLEAKIDAAVESQGNMERSTAKWQKELTQRQEQLDERIQDLKTQQKIWDERFKKLAEQQAKILEHLSDAKKQHEVEQNRSGQREAKKFNNLGVTSFHNGSAGRPGGPRLCRGL